MIAGIEAERLAKEDRRRLVLVAARGQLAEQPVRQPALGLESDDVAEIGLGVEIAAKRDVRPRSDHQQIDALGFVLEGVRGHRHHAGVVPGLEQLVGCRDNSSIHEPDCSKDQTRV